MLSEIPIKQIENDKNHMIALICRILKEKEVKLIETQSRKVVARDWEVGGNRERLVKGCNLSVT